ncbi:hypothetical protein Dimus_010913, partial [Dionaea muscipula]
MPTVPLIHCQSKLGCRRFAGAALLIRRRCSDDSPPLLCRFVHSGVPLGVERMKKKRYWEWYRGDRETNWAGKKAKP